MVNRANILSFAVVAGFVVIDVVLLYRAIGLYRAVPYLPDMYEFIYSSMGERTHQAEGAAVFLFGFPLMAIILSALTLRAWFLQRHDHDPRITRGIVFLTGMFATFALGAESRLAAARTAFDL